MLLELETRNCPVCNNPKKNTTLVGVLAGTDAPFNNSHKFELSLCNSCDLIYLSTMPTKEELFKIYTEHSQFDCDDYRGERANLALEFFNWRVNEILKFANLDRENLKTLEIGGGRSWLSNTVKNISKKNFTVVNDITSELVGQLPWVDKHYIGDIQEMESDLAKHGPYHIILMSHVFEHLIWPLDILRLCKKLLDKNGIILITAPHRPVGWTLSSPFSIWEKWSYNHTPAHINYFNKKSMEKVAENTDLKLVFYEANAEEGQAFEAWLARPEFKSRNEVEKQEESQTEKKIESVNIIQNDPQQKTMNQHEISSSESNKIESLQTTLSTKDSEIEGLQNYTKILEKELNDIKNSIIFKSMKRIARIIDKTPFRKKN